MRMKNFQEDKGITIIAIAIIVVILAVILASVLSGKKDTEKVGFPTDYLEQTTVIDDDNGNKVVIPAGFKMVPECGTTVQQGIVISDRSGNEFVWIPVGTIKNSDGTTTTIELARYSFADNGNIVRKYDEDKLIDGSSSSYVEGSSAVKIDSYSAAKDLSAFKASVNSKGGYYIARYEANRGAGDRALSRSDNSWNYVYQNVAVASAQYTFSSDFVESDLANSYAWDTALVFIQTFSQNKQYSKQTSLNSSLGRTGERNDNTTDKACNIYDMASNCYEWTTEITSTNTPTMVLRGGALGTDSTACSRTTDNTALRDFNKISFRSILYIK